MQLFGILSILLFTFCFIPQVARILKTKNVIGLSLLQWIMVAGGHLCGLIYVISIKDTIMIISYSTGFILALLTLCLVIYYRFGKKSDSDMLS